MSKDTIHNHNTFTWFLFLSHFLQLLNQFENTGPPPADREKIKSLPTVQITEEHVGEWHTNRLCLFPLCCGRVWGKSWLIEAKINSLMVTFCCYLVPDENSPSAQCMTLYWQWTQHRLVWLVLPLQTPGSHLHGVFLYLPDFKLSVAIMYCLGRCPVTQIHKGKTQGFDTACSGGIKGWVLAL